MNNQDEYIIDQQYKDFVKRMTSLVFPELSSAVLDEALSWSIANRYTPHKISLENNYTHQKAEMYIKEITEYIISREPICTAWGVLFKKHDKGPNPLAGMIAEFMDLRGVHKDEMFKYPKGSEDYARFFMLQLLDKLDANATYGVLAEKSSLVYNLNVAASITSQGRSLISAGIMFFEMFLSNNVKFASLDEVLTYIDNVLSERPNRQFKDSDILDRNVTVEECFNKIVSTCGDFRVGKIRWIPNESEMQVIWSVLNRLDSEDINRLFYKNNLYCFFDNPSMQRAILYILDTLDGVYMNPYEVPDEIKVEMEGLLDIVREYVYYGYQIIDKVERNEHMIKTVCLISDTDSAIVCLDGWYKYVDNIVKASGKKFKFEKPFEAFTYFNDPIENMAFTMVDTVEDYDFTNDEIIYKYVENHAFTFEKDDSLRFTIINIMAYIIGVLVDEYMLMVTKQAHSFSIDRKCLIHMKNEFFFDVALMTMNKKNYATRQIRQESKLIPENEQMDIKGMSIKKSTINKTARDELQRILKEQILFSDKIDPVRIIKELAILEKKIRNSLMRGDKEFFKPAAIKSLSNYDDPMRIQGVKAAYIWNIVRDKDLEAIDLSARNTVYIVKVIITEANVGLIKEKYPDVYDKIMIILRDNDIQKFTLAKPMGKGEITALAIPENVRTPEWVKTFIDYDSIVNDSLKNFPLESVGITRMGNQNINYTNIVSI